MPHCKSLRVTLNWDTKLQLLTSFHGLFRKAFKRDIVPLGIIQPFQRHWLLQWELIFFSSICDKEWIKTQARNITVKRQAMYENGKKSIGVFWGTGKEKPAVPSGIRGMLSIPGNEDLYFPPIQSQSLGFKVPSNCNHCMTLWPKDKSSEQTRLCNVEQSRV